MRRIVEANDEVVKEPDLPKQGGHRQGRAKPSHDLVGFAGSEQPDSVIVKLALGSSYYTSKLFWDATPKVHAKAFPYA
jgi:hypothetical protein